jgi:crotonobetainyl-CoA:carnitine CoA-transferase CaiB-like acyl-CoA transferase
MRSSSASAFGCDRAPDLAQDPRFATNLLRTQHRPALIAEIEAELKARPRAALLEKLAANGIPCGEVLGLNQALRSDRAVEAGMVSHAPDDAGRPDVLAPPYRLDGERAPIAPSPAGAGAGYGCGAGRDGAGRRAASSSLRQSGVIA